MKITMHYTYRWSNGLFSGKGNYTCDNNTMDYTGAIEEISRRLHLNTPYNGVEITPVTFTAEADSSAGWKCCLVAFLVTLGGGIVAGVVNTLIQSALR